MAKIPKEAAVVAVCRKYDLDASEFGELLELLGSITPEQKHKIILFSAAWAAKDAMEKALA